MRILDRYILKNTIYGYLFILSVFIGLYFIIDVFSSLSDILEAKPQAAILLDYYFSMLPLIYLRVSPFALLISVLYALGELNKNNEIISIRALGISVLRVILPIVFFCLILSFLSLYLQEKVLVNSQKKVEDIKIQFIKNDGLALDEKNFAFSWENMIFFAREFSPKTKTLKNVTIFKEDTNGNIKKKAICKNIIYENGKWVGSDVIEYKLNDKGSIIGEPLLWKKKDIQLEEKPQELIFRKSAFLAFASLKNLKREINRLKNIKASNLLSNLIIDYHRKLTDPFSHLFLIIGILPLALEIKKRRAGLSSLGVGFIFGFIYYCLNSFTIALGKTGVILPIFGAWLAPLFFLTVGLTGLFLIR